MIIETLKNNRLILAILGVILLVIIVGALIASITAQPPKPQASEVAIVKPTEVTTMTSIEDTDEDVQTEEFAELVDTSLTEQPIPEDEALIKDELIQLTDIDNQLNEQSTILDQQHQDADEIIKLKEQQIAQLEQQLNSP